MNEEENIPEEKLEGQNSKLESVNENSQQESIEQSIANIQPQIKSMETHHPHVHHQKKWKEYLFEFLMLFLAVTIGFFVENTREHYVEQKRAKQFLESLLVDVRTNTKNLDSLLKQDNEIIVNHDSLVLWLLADSVSIDRAAFANKLGAVWIRNFLVRKETYEQMKSSGSLRYVGDIEFLKSLMDYERITNFAQYRNQEFEKKYYTELFIPALYKSYDLTCQINLDTSNHSNPAMIEKIAHHHDVLTGNEAATFRHDMGAALMLRLERLRRSRDAFKDARVKCIEMEQLINRQLGEPAAK